MTNQFEKVIIYILLFIGVLLSLGQFFYNRTLCGDEVWLALNIVDRSGVELLSPLDYVQSAPVLFLELEKLFSIIVPHSEMGLKIFPLISYLLSLLLFFKILKTIHQNNYTIIFGLSLFVFNIFLIRYSNEVKQYMTDILVLTYLYYLVLRCNKEISYKYFHLSLAGIISIFLSNVSIVILCTVGLYLFYISLRERKMQVKYLLLVFISWFISFSIYYILFVHNNPVKNRMVEMWDEAFMPTNPLSSEFYLFILRKGSMLLLNFFQYGNMGEWLSIFLVVGTIYMIKKRRVDYIILIFVPIVLQFALSGLKLYPLLARTWLFLCPVLILVFSFGFDWIITTIFRYFKTNGFKPLAISIPFMLLIYFFFLIKVDSYPFRRSELKNSIKYIERNKEKNDKVYVTYFAGWAYQYYKNIGFMQIENITVVGSQKYKEIRQDYYNELDTLNGRVWFLFTDIGDESNENKEIVLGYLDKKGEKIVAEYHTWASDVYLYDLR